MSTHYHLLLFQLLCYLQHFMHIHSEFIKPSAENTATFKTVIIALVMSSSGTAYMDGRCPKDCKEMRNSTKFSESRNTFVMSVKLPKQRWRMHSIANFGQNRNKCSAISSSVSKCEQTTDAIGPTIVSQKYRTT